MRTDKLIEKNIYSLEFSIKDLLGTVYPFLN